MTRIEFYIPSVTTRFRTSSWCTIGVTAAWCEVSHALKRQKHFCAWWETTFKCMDSHIGVWGAWNWIERGAGWQWSALWWTCWTKVAWHPAGRWTWPTQCECWACLVTVFYQRSPLFYRRVAPVMSCGYFWMYTRSRMSFHYSSVARDEGAPSFCCFYSHYHGCQKFGKQKSRFKF